MKDYTIKTPFGEVHGQVEDTRLWAVGVLLAQTAVLAAWVLATAAMIVIAGNSMLKSGQLEIFPVFAIIAFVFSWFA